MFMVYGHTGFMTAGSFWLSDPHPWACTCPGNFWLLAPAYQEPVHVVRCIARVQECVDR